MTSSVIPGSGRPLEPKDFRRIIGTTSSSLSIPIRLRIEVVEPRQEGER